jgi:MFS family permease
VSRRGRRELVVPASLLAGLAVQFGATTLAGESPERLTRFNGTDLPLLFALRVTGSLLVGDRFLDDTWLSLGRVFAYGALLAVAAALLAGAVRSERATRLFVAVAAGYAVVLFGVFLAGRGTAGMRPGMDEASWHLAGARFTYAPILLLAAALLAVVDRPCRMRAGQPAASRLEQRSRSSRCSWPRTSISRASARWVRRGSRSSRPQVSAATRGRTTRAFGWRRSPSASSSRRPAATCASRPPGRRAPRRPRDVGRRRVGRMGLHYPHLAGELAAAPACADPAT